MLVLSITAARFTLYFIAILPYFVLGFDNMRFFSPGNWRGVINSKITIVVAKTTGVHRNGPVVPVTICQRGELKYFPDTNFVESIEKHISRLRISRLRVPHWFFKEITVKVIKRSTEDFIFEDKLPALATVKIKRYQSFFDNEKHESVSDGGIWLDANRFKNKEGSPMLIPILESDKYETRFYLFMQDGSEVPVRCWDRLYEVDQSLKYTIDDQEIFHGRRPIQLEALVGTRGLSEALWISYKREHVSFHLELPILPSDGLLKIVLSFSKKVQPSSFSLPWPKFGSHSTAIDFLTIEAANYGVSATQGFNFDFSEGLPVPDGISHSQLVGFQLFMSNGDVTNHVPIRFLNLDDLSTGRRLYGESGMIDWGDINRQSATIALEAFEVAEKVVKLNRNEVIYMDYFTKGECDGKSRTGVLFTYQLSPVALIRLRIPKKFLKFRIPNQESETRSLGWLGYLKRVWVERMAQLYTSLDKFFNPKSERELRSCYQRGCYGHQESLKWRERQKIKLFEQVQMNLDLQVIRNYSAIKISKSQPICAHRITIPKQEHDEFYTDAQNGIRLVRINPDSPQPITWSARLGKNNVTEFRSRYKEARSADNR